MTSRTLRRTTTALFLVSALGAGIAIGRFTAPETAAADAPDAVANSAPPAAEPAPGADGATADSPAVSGRVVDASGAPVAGAVVVARLARPAGLQQSVAYLPTSGEPPVDLTREGVVTDDSGRFSLFGLPPGRYILVAIHGHHSPGRSGPVVVADSGLSLVIEVTLEAETLPA